MTTPDYPVNLPIWVDLASSNLDAARAFYTALFGWDAETMPAPEAGGYTIFRLGGKMVAGAGPVMSPQQPSAWSTYVSTEDADATAQAVKDAGGQVVAPPFDVFDSGRMGVFQDPTGAYFSVWQPNQHKGAELVNVPGSFVWNELATRDLDAAKEFYGKVFGWGAETHGHGENAYTEWQLDGRSMAGAMVMGKNYPPNVPPNWLVYFGTENTDAAAEKVKALGGNVMLPGMDIGIGRFAVVSDPTGAVFALFQGKGVG